MSDVLEQTPRLRFGIWFFRIFDVIAAARIPGQLVDRDFLLAGMTLALMPVCSVMVHVVAASLNWRSRE